MVSQKNVRGNEFTIVIIPSEPRFSPASAPLPLLFKSIVIHQRLDNSVYRICVCVFVYVRTRLLNRRGDRVTKRVPRLYIYTYILGSSQVEGIRAVVALLGFFLLKNRSKHNATNALPSDKYK